MLQQCLPTEGVIFRGHGIQSQELVPWRGRGCGGPPRAAWQCSGVSAPLGEEIVHWEHA